MKAWRIGVAVSVLCVMAVASVGAEERAESEKTPYISAEVLKEWMAKKWPITFLDVRAQDEFDAGHLAGAIHIHYDEVASIVDQLPKIKPIVVYCIHSIHRAPAAAQRLRELGFDNAYVLEGGLVALQEAGFQLRSSDLAKAPAILPKTERCAIPAQ